MSEPPPFRNANSTPGWTAILMAPALAGLLVVHHVQTPAFRAVFLPPLRWDAFRTAASQWPFYFDVVIAVAGVLFAAVIIQTFRNGAAAASISMGAASAWLFLPLLALVAYESWRAYGVRHLGESGAAMVGKGLLLAYPWAATLGMAGLLAGILRALLPAGSGRDRPGRSLAFAWLGVGIYVATFGILATLQYRALHVPHGDTGMYEEHLWNVAHGKGFRSELDSGRLFLGERFQVIHLALLPIHWLKPSLLTLNWAESTALGLTGMAVWLLARSMQLRPAAASALAWAALAYFPLESLDQEQSWKTFRPNSFGIPLAAFALAALERERYRLAVCLLFASFLAAEDYSLVAAAIGVYVALSRNGGRLPRRQALLMGGAIVLVAVAFLAMVLLVVLPYFRGGGNPHYTPYFKSLGNSPLEIVKTVITQPRMILERLATVQNVQLCLMLIGPLAFLPLASPFRLATTLPVLGFLMLGERDGMNEPFFHFHGPLVAPLLWATVGGCARLARRFDDVSVARFALAASLVSTIWFGPSPIAWKFHDPMAGTVWQFGGGAGPTFKPAGQYWRDKYLATERAASFDHVIAGIRPNERVAATDYIRTRFTHFGAAHEYPPLKDHVSIDDIDVVVLDLAEGYWGRGPTNVDRELLMAVGNPNLKAGARIVVRGKPGQPARPFEVVWRDRWFLAIRRVPEK